MSFLCTRVHIIWSTARREPMIQEEWRPRLHGYIRGILENLKSRVFIVGGTADHVHSYSSLPSTIAVADLPSAIKSNSSRWVHEELKSPFDWQDGYAAFTASKSADDAIIRYIRGQEEHHRRKSFQGGN